MAITRARRKSTFGADTGPIIRAEPPDLEVSGTAANVSTVWDSSNVTMTAKDLEGFPVTYGISYYDSAGNNSYKNDSANLPPQLVHPTQITDSAGTGKYRVLWRKTDSDGSGNTLANPLKFRYTATDGIKTSFTTKLFTKSFTVPVTFSSSENGISSNTSNTFSVSFSAQTYAGSGGGYMAKSSTLDTGKKYLEIHLASGGSGNPFIGFGLTGVDQYWNTTNTATWYMHSTHNKFYPDEEASGLTVYDFSSNNKLMLAWDTTTRKVWIGGNGTWHGDPAGGTNPAATFSTGSICLALGSGGAASYSGDIKLGANQTYTVPTGFTSQ